MAYKVIVKDLDVVVQYWPMKWREPLIIEELSTKPAADVPEELVRMVTMILMENPQQKLPWTLRHNVSLRK